MKYLFVLHVLVWVPIVHAAPVHDPARADHLMRAARDRYDRGNYLAAIRYAESAAQADPARWQAWNLDGDARLALGDRQSALTVYAYSLYLHPDQPELRRQVGRVAASRRPPPPPGAEARKARPVTTGVELLGPTLTLASATFSLTVDPHWSAGLHVGGAPGGIVGAGAFAVRHLGTGASAPFILTGLAADVWPAIERVATANLALGYEWRRPSGLTIRAGVYGHLMLHGTWDLYYDGDPSGRPHHVRAWAWPGLSFAYSR